MKLISITALFLLGFIQLFSQQADTLIVPKPDKKHNIFGVSFVQQGPKMNVGISDNFGVLLMYGRDFPSHKDSTYNILSGNNYIVAKVGYLHKQFDNNTTNNDLIATLGILIRQPAYKAEMLSLQFGIDMGILNRKNEKIMFYTCLNGGFLFNIYKGLELGADIKVQANKLDNTYAGIGLGVNYKF